MSGIASITSSPTSTLSSVGQSLLDTGSAPVAAAPSSTSSATSATSGSSSTSSTTSASSKLSSYQSEYLTLQQQDTAELLYASFLTPEQGLANADAVLDQAAHLLGTPGSTGTIDFSV